MRLVGYLLFRHLRFSYIRQEPRVSRSATQKVHPRLAQAELPVHRQPHFSCVLVGLAVILTPAHRAEFHRLWRLQCPVTAARAAEQQAHIQMDVSPGCWITKTEHDAPLGNPVILRGRVFPSTALP